MSKSNLLNTLLSYLYSILILFNTWSVHYYLLRSNRYINVLYTIFIFIKLFLRLTFSKSSQKLQEIITCDTGYHTKYNIGYPLSQVKVILFGQILLLFEKANGEIFCWNKNENRIKNENWKWINYFVKHMYYLLLRNR